MRLLTLTPEKPPTVSISRVIAMIDVRKLALCLSSETIVGSRRPILK